MRSKRPVLVPIKKIQPIVLRDFSRAIDMITREAFMQMKTQRMEGKKPEALPAPEPETIEAES